MSNIQSNLQKLTRVNKGDDIRSVASSDRMHALQEVVKSLARGDHIVTNRSRIRKQSSEGLMSLQVNPERKFPVQSTFPWEINVHTDPDTGNTYATVEPGTISGLLPINLLDNILISDAPDVQWYVKINCQTNGKIPTVVRLYADNNIIDNNTATAQNTAPPAFDVYIGMIKNSNIYQIVRDNLLAEPDIAFIESRIPPSLGEEPFLRWWYWKIVSV